MDLVLKGRGVRITDDLRELVGLKIAKIPRVEPRVARVEVEIISEKNPRLDGIKRIEGAVDIPRKTFRARAEHREVEAALGRLVERLGRQLKDHRTKKRRQVIHGANRLKSARAEDAGWE